MAEFASPQRSAPDSGDIATELQLRSFYTHPSRILLGLNDTGTPVGVVALPSLTRSARAESGDHDGLDRQAGMAPLRKTVSETPSATTPTT